MDPKSKFSVSALSAILSFLSAIISIYLKVWDAKGSQSSNLLFAVLSAVLLTVFLFLQWQTIRHNIETKPFVTSVVLVTSFVAVSALLSWIAGGSTSTAMQAASLATLFCLVITLSIRHAADTRVTTSYLGDFPSNLPVLLDLIASARFEILALTDVFAYGAFSAPSLFAELQKNIRERKLAPDMRIVWAAYEPHRAMESVRHQLEISGIEAGHPKEIQFLTSDRMLRFLQRNPGLNPPTSLDNFLSSVLTRINDAFKDEMGRIGVSVNTTVNSPALFHIWIIDRRVAVFSIVSENPNAFLEETFVTRDPALIAVLRRVGSPHWGR